MEVRSTAANFHPTSRIWLVILKIWDQTGPIDWGFTSSSALVGYAPTDRSRISGHLPTAWNYFKVFLCADCMHTTVQKLPQWTTACPHWLSNKDALKVVRLRHFTIYISLRYMTYYLFFHRKKTHSCAMNLLYWLLRYIEFTTYRKCVFCDGNS